MSSEHWPGEIEPISLDLVWDTTTDGVWVEIGELDDPQREVTVSFSDSRWPWFTRCVPGFLWRFLPGWAFREMTCAFPATLTEYEVTTDADGVATISATLKPTGAATWVDDGGSSAEPQGWCGDPSCCPDPRRERNGSS